jgi:small redox-active disulfide protein 2
MEKNMKIEILGMGCPKCQLLTANSEAALKELGIKAEIVKVTDIDKITEYGVMMTPALAINGKVKSAGKVLSAEDIKKIISEIPKQE